MTAEDKMCTLSCESGFDVISQARFSLHVFKNPPSLQGGKFEALLILKVFEVLRYKENV